MNALVLNLKLIVAILLLPLLVAGCRTTQTVGKRGPISESQRAKIGRIAIEVQAEPKIEINGITRSKAGGAGKGAMGGALVGTSIGAETGLLAILLIPAFAVVGAGVGAITGVVVAKDKETTKRNTEAIEEIVAGASTQLEHSVEKELSSLEGWPYRLESNSADILSNEDSEYQSRLVLKFDRLSGMSEGNLSPQSRLMFQWSSSARLYFGNDTFVSDERHYQFNTKTMPLAKWANNNGSALNDEILTFARIAARGIIDDFFRNSSMSVALEHPASRGVFKPRRIETFTPVLRWRLIDSGKPIDPEIESTVSYHLVVLSSEGGEQKFEDLDTNFQEVRLRPNETYRWKVQASYRARDQLRRTPWMLESRFRSPKK